MPFNNRLTFVPVALWKVARDQMTEARNYHGIDPDGIAETEADHFGNCPACGAFIDMRDLGQVLAHVHDAEIEMGEGPEPPLRDGSVQ